MSPVLGEPNLVHRAAMGQGSQTKRQVFGADLTTTRIGGGSCCRVVTRLWSQSLRLGFGVGLDHDNEMGQWLTHRVITEQQGWRSLPLLVSGLPTSKNEARARPSSRPEAMGDRSSLQMLVSDLTHGSVAPLLRRCKRREPALCWCQNRRRR
jgi:hypothetical protein